MIISAHQARGILQRHSEETKPLRLSDINTAESNRRGDDFISVHKSEGGRTLIVDLSRQRIDTFNHLFRLFGTLGIKEKIRDLAWGRTGRTGDRREGPYNNFASVAMYHRSVSFANSRSLSDVFRGSRGDEVADGGAEGSSYHLAFRVPPGQGHVMYAPNDTSNVLDEIHTIFERVKHLSNSIRQGKRLGYSGRPMCDVLVVSAGGVVPKALEFIYELLLLDEHGEASAEVDASTLLPSKSNSQSNSNINCAAPQSSSLQSSVYNLVATPFKKHSTGSHGGSSPTKLFGQSHTTRRRRQLRVITSSDPSLIKRALSDGLRPSTTIVITLSLDREKERETKAITASIRNWLLSGLQDSVEQKSRDRAVAAHMYLVTGKDMMRRAGSNSYAVPNHTRCEAFSTFTAAGLLPLSILFGWDVAQRVLEGAHDMDSHFVESSARHNIPVLLALVDLWNEEFLGSNGRTVSPFSEALSAYPEFVARLESSVLSSSKCRPLVFGAGQSLNASTSTEFIMALKSSNDPTDHEQRLCKLFARADTMAFGLEDGARTRSFSSSPTALAIQSVDSMGSQGSVVPSDDVGDQTCTLLLCDKCDAYTAGQLVALEEHRATVKAWLREVNPFSPQSDPVQNERLDNIAKKLNDMKSVIANGGELEGGDEGREEEDNINASTMTMLRNYIHLDT